MQRGTIERRIRDVHARLLLAREELAVSEEQLEIFVATADEARIRSLVSETPLADHEWHEAQRHAEAMTRARDLALAEVGELERARDELLSKLVV